MITAGVRQVKNNLSRYLGSVKRGQTILITERGRAIARLVGESSRRSTYREKLAPLVAQGVIELPIRPIKRKKSLPVEVSGRPLSSLIIEDRR